VATEVLLRSKAPRAGTWPLTSILCWG